jgi:hypothetical protein
VPIILIFNGRVISPNLHVIRVIYNYFDYLSSITPIYGDTEYFASTLLYSDCGTIANLALISE